MHGTSDRFVPAAMSERLYAAAPEPKRLLLVESGNHSNVATMAFDKYQAAVRDFLALVRDGPARARASAGRGGCTASSGLPFLASAAFMRRSTGARSSTRSREAFRAGANAPVRSSYPVTDAGDRLL